MSSRTLEIHRDCGGLVKLVHEMWKCLKCGAGPLGVSPTRWMTEDEHHGYAWRMHGAMYPKTEHPTYVRNPVEFDRGLSVAEMVLKDHEICSRNT